MTQPGLNLNRTLAYGCLAFPLAFAALPLYIHVPHLYVDVSHLDIGLLGFLLLAARLLDAGIDPWLGWLADRSSRRHMLAWGSLPFGLGFVCLLNPPPTQVALWLFASLTVTYFGFSAITVAYQAWSTDLTLSSESRTRLAAAREGFGMLGIVLAATLPSFLGESLSQGITRLAWCLPPLLLCAALITLGQGRSGQTSIRSDEQKNLRSSLGHVLTDPSFARLLLVFAINGLSAALPATLFLFFVSDVLQAESSAGPLLALYFMAGAVALPLWVRLAKRYGRVNVWLCSMLLSMLSFGGAAFLGAGDVLWFSAICFLSGLALGADLALPSAMAADLGGQNGLAGSCFGIWNFVAKLNLAMAAGLALPLLAWLGYQPGTEQAVEALSLAYAFMPLAFKLFACWLLWHWRSFLEIRS